MLGQERLSKVRWKLRSSRQQQTNTLTDDFKIICESLWIQGPHTENVFLDKCHANLSVHDPWTQSHQKHGRFSVPVMM